MATVATNKEAMSCVDLIGETAGLVWNSLHEDGPRTITKLIKSVDAPRDVVMQAIGWLAREGKIEIDEQGRSRTICLCETGY